MLRLFLETSIVDGNKNKTFMRTGPAGAELDAGHGERDAGHADAGGICLGLESCHSPIGVRFWWNGLRQDSK